MVGYIRECADLFKVRINDTVLFTIGNLIVLAGYGTVVIIIAAKVRHYRFMCH